jgi:hypothetical protein
VSSSNARMVTSTGGSDLHLYPVDRMNSAMVKIEASGDGGGASSARIGNRSPSVLSEKRETELAVLRSEMMAGRAQTRSGGAKREAEGGGMSGSGGKKGKKDSGDGAPGDGAPAGNGAPAGDGAPVPR